MSWSIKDYIAKRLRRPRQDAAAHEAEPVAKRRGELARILLTSSEFNEAYLDELEKVVTAFLEVDIHDPGARDKLFALAADASSLQGLVRRLGGYANRAKLIEHREKASVRRAIL